MFKYCPNCKAETVEFDGVKKYVCTSCWWTFYRNSATAAMAILTYENKILFSVRAREPALGKLDLPGGFVDPGENAETAIERELHEELGVSDLQYKYLGSAVNYYEYKSIVYPTCDVIFTAALKKIPTKIDASEIQEIRMLEVHEVDESELSFPSVGKALKIYTPSLQK